MAAAASSSLSLAARMQAEADFFHAERIGALPSLEEEKAELDQALHERTQEVFQALRERDVLVDALSQTLLDETLSAVALQAPVKKLEEVQALLKKMGEEKRGVQGHLKSCQETLQMLTSQNRVLRTSLEELQASLKQPTAPSYTAREVVKIGQQIVAHVAGKRS